MVLFCPTSRTGPNSPAQLKVRKFPGRTQSKNDRRRTLWKAGRSAGVIVILFLIVSEQQVFLSRRLSEILVQNSLGNSEHSFQLVETPKRFGRQPIEVRKERPPQIPIIYTGPLPGGVGNQLSCAFQSLGIARKHHLEYYLPPLRTRKGLHPISPDSVFDLSNVRRLVPKLHIQLPSVCDEGRGGKFDVQILLDYVSPPANTSLTPDPKQLKSQTGVQVRMRRYSLDAIVNLQDEIRQILAARPERERKKDSGREAICVHAGIHAARPDYKVAPAFLPSKKYRKAAMRWPLATMAVVHLRYDEHIRACGKGPPNGKDSLHHVCLLRHRLLETYWVPHLQYVARVAQELKGTGVTSLYLTKSQYMEQKAWENLAGAFTRKTNFHIEESASSFYKGEELNYVERELARASHFFIAEARSTWSRTVVAMRNSQSRTRERAIQMFFADEHDP